MDNNKLENFEVSNNSNTMPLLQISLLTPNTPIKCKKCNKTFSKSKGLSKHMKIHGDKTYKCDKCEKTYSRSDHLKRHMISHEDDKRPFHCELCLHRFSNKSHLNRHFKLVHIENLEKFSFKCDECEETFDKKFKLSKHKAKHNKTNECNKAAKRYECYYPFCQRKFTTSRKQQLHVLFIHKHRNLELNQSEDAKLNNTMDTCIDNISSNLNFDLITPSEKETILKCPIENCHKSYTTMFNLKTHIKTYHYSLKEFKCNEINCNQLFKHKCSLERHKIKYHNPSKSGSRDFLSTITIDEEMEEQDFYSKNILLREMDRDMIENNQ